MSVVVIVMYPDKKYTRKISSNILKSGLHTQDLLCIPPTHRDGLSKEGWRALLSIVMYGFCSNKTLYSTSLSFTMFSLTGPTKKRLPFLELDH